MATALDYFAEDQIRRISQASFELGRLHGQEDLLAQYNRCNNWQGLNAIDFESQKRDWYQELNSGTYKFLYRAVGGSYFLNMDRNGEYWLDNVRSEGIFVQMPETPISPPTQSTLQDHDLSQSVSGVNLGDYSGSSASDGSSQDYDDDDSEIKGSKRISQLKVVGPTKKVKFAKSQQQPHLVGGARNKEGKFTSCRHLVDGVWKEGKCIVQTPSPGGYPYLNLIPAGSELDNEQLDNIEATPIKRADIRTYSGHNNDGATTNRNFGTRRALHSSSIAMSFDWNVGQGQLPISYDRDVSFGSIKEDPEFARYVAAQETRVVKVKAFVNERMTGTEYNYWENWAGSKSHPLRAIPGEPGLSKIPLELWPFYLIRTPNLNLYHMCRHQIGVPLPELIPIRVYNTEKNKSLVIWLPKNCGPGSRFHNTLKACGRIPHETLAKACGFRQASELSKGLMVFINNLCFGNIGYHELYYGQCEVCGTYYCHLDKRVDHPCQNGEFEED